MTRKNVTVRPPSRPDSEPTAAPLDPRVDEIIDLLISAPNLAGIKTAAAALKARQAAAGVPATPGTTTPRK